jgi:hypothetical protein
VRQHAIIASSAVRFVSNRPIWDLTTSGKPAGPTSAGSGTTAGSGTGAGTQGAGSGTPVGAPPCGFVEFSDPHGSHYDSATRGFWVDIRMSVHFADGSSQSTILDYPWYYASEAENPWSDRNLRDPNFPTRFQAPPMDKVADEPQLVRYVMQHSTFDGATLLNDCPQAPATPAAQHLSPKARL